ncbi:MAG: hypothetical protein PWR30_40 [Candidatus Woesearchaeota archaeon]|nr:hypothetical protein [Candidatus Woesearchaeota archaeon]
MNDKLLKRFLLLLVKTTFSVTKETKINIAQYYQEKSNNYKNEMSATFIEASLEPL